MLGPEYDDHLTAYLRGGVISTRYRGVLYAMSDVVCVTRLHAPAALEGTQPVLAQPGLGVPHLIQPGPGHPCGHPLLSHARPEGADGLWGRCGRCACQGHDPGFPTDPLVWCRWCARDLSLPDAVELFNRRGGKFWICRPCDRDPMASFPIVTRNR